MRLEFLIDWKINEIEVFSWVSMFLGIVVFLVIVFWDNIAGVNIAHNAGWGLWQKAGLLISGLYVTYCGLMQYRWREK